MTRTHHPSLSGPRHAGWTPWVCLAIGAILLPFAQVQTVLPFAAWLAPIFLMRFARRTRLIVWIPVIAVVSYAASVIALRNIFPWPMVFLVSVTAVSAVVPYLLDRLVARRLPVFLSTLIFPAASVILEWLISLSGLGTLGSVVNSQGGVLTLGQASSVVGIWGILFLITWCAPAVNTAWEIGPTQRSAQRAIAPLLAVLVLVVAAGSARLAFAEQPSSTVRVAGLTADRELQEAMEAPSIQEVAVGSTAVRESARAEFAPVVDELFTRTESTARDGARIVAWAEAAGFVLKEDEEAMVDRARQIATEHEIYLQLAIVTVLDTDTFPYAENRAIMVDPEGNVSWNYPKTVHPFGDNAVFEPGPGELPTVSTPYGTLSTIICYDADYPALVRQAGRAGVDILLVPSNDWQPIDIMHAQASHFRAIENGLTLVRPTGSGVSVTVNHLGRELATGNSFQTDQVTMIADVPTQGVPTAYSVIGDIVVHISFGLLAILTMASLIRRRDKVPHDQEIDLDQTGEPELVGSRV